MHILLSNDDGLFAEGLQTLRQELREARPDVRITTVAPNAEQSASSHSLTLSEPLRVEEHPDGQFSVSGTPTDCVLVAIHGLLKNDPPDVILSGINHGPNMGEDVHYSGTVAAAFEGMVLGVPGLALSLADKKRRDFSGARHFVRTLLVEWLEDELDTGTLLNVNIPATPFEEIKGVRVCPLGSRQYHDTIVENQDPRGRAYYWIGGDSFTHSEDENTDFVLSSRGYITVTPLQVDLTDYKRIVALEKWERSFGP